MKNIVLILLLACCWGPSYVLIKFALDSFPPLTVVTLRLALAALIIFVMLKMRGGHLPKWGRIWKHFFFMGIVATAAPFLLITFGEETIDSSLAAIINGSAPIFTVVLAHLFVPGERLNAPRVVGVALGFTGLLCLILPTLADGVRGSIYGATAVCLAAVCYALGFVYSRRMLTKTEPLVAPAGQLIAVSAFLIPLCLIMDKPYSLALPSLWAVAAVVGLAVIGTVCAFILYYKIIEVAGATHLSMATYCLPVLGIILGVVFLGEEPGWNAYVGTILVTLGLMVNNGIIPLPIGDIEKIP